MSDIRMRVSAVDVKAITSERVENGKLVVEFGPGREGLHGAGRVVCEPAPGQPDGETVTRLGARFRDDGIFFPDGGHLTRGQKRRGECSHCGFATRVKCYAVDSYEERVTWPNGRWLCAVCAGTMLGNMHGLSNYDGDAVMLSRGIAGAVNMILKEIRRSRKKAK